MHPHRSSALGYASAASALHSRRYGACSAEAAASEAFGLRVGGCIRAWRDFGPYPVAGAAQSVGTCDLVPKKRIVSLRTGCCSSPKSSGFRGRRMRSGISGYQTPSSGRRVTRVVSLAA